MTELQLQTIDKKTQAALKKAITIERRFKNLEREREVLRGLLLTAMEKHDIKKIETDEFSLVYVEPTISTSFDGAKFKKDHPETYELYLKQSKRKAYVKIDLK